MSARTRLPENVGAAASASLNGAADEDVDEPSGRNSRAIASSAADASREKINRWAS